MRCKKRCQIEPCRVCGEYPKFMTIRENGRYYLLIYCDNARPNASNIIQVKRHEGFIRAMIHEIDSKCSLRQAKTCLIKGWNQKQTEPLEMEFIVKCNQLVSE